MIKITLPGRPITKKNSQEMFRNAKTGKMFPVQSKQYREYEKTCLFALRRVPDQFFGPVTMKALYWMPNRVGEPDLLGLLQATSDILERAKIIDNDKNIISFDGSRIVGIDAVRPRVEIELCEYTGENSQICLM